MTINYATTKNKSSTIIYPNTTPTISGAPTQSTTALDSNRPLPSDDLLVVSVWTSLLTYAFVANLLTLAGIFRNQQMRRSTSYWLIISLSICDLFMIVISMCHLIPATVWHDDFVTKSDYRNVFALFLYDVFWYSGVIQLGGMAVNRYISIVHSMYYRRLFTKENTLLLIALLYALGLGASLPALFPCCYTIYDHNLWITYYVKEDSWYYVIDLGLNTISLAIMVFCYACILFKVRQSHLSTRRHRLGRSGGGTDRSMRRHKATGGPFATTNNNVLVLASAAPFDAPTVSSANNNSNNNNNRVNNAHNSINNNNQHHYKQQPQRQLSKQKQQHLATTTVTMTTNNDNKTTLSSCESGPGQRASVPVLAAMASMVACKMSRGSNASSLRQDLRNSATNLSQQNATTQQQQQQQQRHTNQPSRREMNLFVQFFVVSAVFLATFLTWQWLFRIQDASRWIYFATTSFFFVNNAVNPTVYLIYNSNLRREVNTMLCWWADGRCGGSKGSGQPQMTPSSDLNQQQPPEVVVPQESIVMTGGSGVNATTPLLLHKKALL